MQSYLSNTTSKILTTAICASALLTAAAHAWDFSYGYQTVFDANADWYIVGQQNVRKYSEWQTPPVTYWGPSANDVPAVLTSRFTFSAPTAEIFVSARLNSSSYLDRGDYGASSLWASMDGTSWQLLADCPVPTGSRDLIGRQVYYNEAVPASLLGADEFWIQVRMQEHGALATAPDPRATWADAQFGRWDGAAGGFQLSATLVPEPSAGALILSACALFYFLCPARGMARGGKLLTLVRSQRER